MDGLRIVECTPGVAEDALAVRNAIFPPLTLDQWLATKTMTGAVAYLGDDPVGCIPMDQRDFLAAPDTPIRVIFENAVGTREDMRSKGIGTAMIDAAGEFLSDRIDVMMVYRGGERTDGYRFYEKSGHRDLIYLRGMTWREASGRTQGVGVGGPAEMAEDADEIHAAFAATYGELAGFPPRSAGYQHAQLDHQIYTVIPQDTVYLRYPDRGELEAYCILAGHTEGKPDRPMMVDEMASRTGDEAMRKVLSAVGAEAASRERAVTRHSSHDDPFRPLAREVGFREDLRSTMIMARIVRPQALFEKTCVDAGLVEDLKINVWTPSQDYVLHEGPEARVEITIEGKDAEITRMLCRRLDVQRAVDHDIISIRNGTPEIAERLGSALPFARWVYHHIDYL